MAASEDAAIGGPGRRGVRHALLSRLLGSRLASHPASVSARMGILGWCVMGLLAGGLARRAIGAPKRGCLGTIAIGVLGALFAGAASRFATGDEIATFDELDIGSLFVAFIGAAALLLVLEAASGRRR